MTGSKPHISIIAGPNGSGKSTCGPAILQNIFQISEFVNADTIATGLSAFQPGDVAIEASRIMLNRLKEYANRKENLLLHQAVGNKIAYWDKSKIAVAPLFVQDFCVNSVR